MATYKTDRDRNYGFVGKFKFSYTVRFLTRDINDNNFTSAQIKDMQQNAINDYFNN